MTMDRMPSMGPFDGLFSVVGRESYTSSTEESGFPIFSKQTVHRGGDPDMVMVSTFVIMTGERSEFYGCTSEECIDGIFWIANPYSVAYEPA